MQFKTFVNAVALALFAAGAHAKVPSGTYSIVNKVPSSDNLQRVITFNGNGQTVTVSSDDPLASQQVYPASINHLICLVSPTLQQWIVEDYDERTQSISPVDGDGLQCAWGQGVVTVLPAHNYVWTITQNEDETYTYV